MTMMFKNFKLISPIEILTIQNLQFDFHNNANFRQVISLSRLKTVWVLWNYPSKWFIEEGYKMYRKKDLKK